MNWFHTIAILATVGSVLAGPTQQIQILTADWFDCSGKPDGDYPHPYECTMYITCVAQEYAYERECASCMSLPERCSYGKDVFDATARSCLWADETECLVQGSTTRPPVTNGTTTEIPTTTEEAIPTSTEGTTREPSTELPTTQLPITTEVPTTQPPVPTEIPTTTETPKTEPPVTTEVPTTQPPTETTNTPPPTTTVAPTTEAPTQVPTDAPEPSTTEQSGGPPKAGDPCDPEICRNTGYCQSYLRCDRETSRLVEEQCGDGMFWNPFNPNGTDQIHGGNCDLLENLSPELEKELRSDPECLACFWMSTGECESEYLYQPPGQNNRNVLTLRCSEGLVFSQKKETCQLCDAVARADGSTCCDNDK